jgi:hypothetical protein
MANPIPLVEPETSAVLSVNFKSIDSRKIDAAATIEGSSA